MGVAVSMTHPFILHMENGKCVSGSVFSIFSLDDLYIILSIYWFITYYGGPCLLFIILYGRIILLFKKRQVNKDLSESKTIDNASKQVTKTVIIVCMCFVVFVGVDQVYLLLLSINYSRFVLDSSIQNIFLLLYILNLCNNPVVYIITMPAFRVCLMKMFSPSRKRPDRKSNISNTGNAQNNDID